MANIFISYRRDDSAGYAGRVHDRLQMALPSDLLFMDVDAIPLGANFIDVLKSEVGRCDALLAVIGPRWLNIANEQGVRRLHDASDFVRVEVATALTRNIPVIPVLVDGGAIPPADQLPDELRELSLRNGISIRHDSFHADMTRLIRRLQEILPRGRPEQSAKPAAVASHAAATPAGRQPPVRTPHVAAKATVSQSSPQTFRQTAKSTTAWTSEWPVAFFGLAAGLAIAIGAVTLLDEVTGNPTETYRISSIFVLLSTAVFLTYNVRLTTMRDLSAFITMAAYTWCVCGWIGVFYVEQIMAVPVRRLDTAGFLTGYSFVATMHLWLMIRRSTHRNTQQARQTA